MVMVPTVHLNGTSKEALLDGYCEAIEALHHAGSLMAATYPNARDYYVRGSNAINEAMDEHESRMTRLKEIIKELETIAESL